MRLFSKFTFICNCCFIAAVILRFVEMRNKPSGTGNEVIQLAPLQSTLVVLGYGAILINLVFIIVFILMAMGAKRKRLFNWIAIVNLLFFPLQVYYFFFSEF